MLYISIYVTIILGTVNLVTTPPVTGIPVTATRLELNRKFIEAPG